MAAAKEKELEFFGSLPDFKSLEGAPVYLAIGRHLENLIREGALPEGRRLPPTKEMAKSFKVTVSTLQHSLEYLVGRGLLKRTPRTGTHVARLRRGEGICLLVGENPYAIESKYPLLMLKAIAEVARREGFSIDCNFPLGRANAETQCQRLQEDVAAGRYACVLVLCGSDELLRWLQSQENVPYAWTVGGDARHNAFLGMDYLLKRGFRKIAFVSMFNLEDPRSDDIGREYEGVLNACVSNGTGFDPSIVHYWSKTMEKGYEDALRFLSDPAKLPEAVFINHDLMAKSFLRAAEKLKVKIPRDIALIAHANKGDSFAHPLPITRVENDPEAIASETLTQLRQLILSSEKLVHVLGGHRFPFHRASIVAGRSCGEATA